MWWRCSGASTKKRNASSHDQYQAILGTLSTEPVDPAAIDAQSMNVLQIEKDLERTFPTNSKFKNEEGIAALRRVLLAYGCWTKTNFTHIEFTPRDSCVAQATAEQPSTHNTFNFTYGTTCVHGKQANCLTCTSQVLPAQPGFRLLPKHVSAC